MNTKILVSLLVIGLTAIAIGGGMTGAFFSDTETSSGNTFTAGAIDLKVDNHCYYNGMECRLADDDEYHWNGDVNEDECFCTWNLTDLDNEVFADFSDLKPGDHGEDTISFHVNNNDAWLCAHVKITEDSDVDCTEPETESGDPECAPNIVPYVGNGELDNYLTVFAWIDECNNTELQAYPGDNKYQPGCDQAISAKPTIIPIPVRLTDYEGAFPIADTTFSIAGMANERGLPLTGGKDYYIGTAWCFGNMKVDLSTGEIICDGRNVQNDAQTDKLKLDVSFEAVQAKNNEDFVCSDYYSGEEWTLQLENENQYGIPITDDNTSGTLIFKSPYPEFDYHLTVQGLRANTNYSLIYYKEAPAHFQDSWKGPGSIRIGEFTTDGNGSADVNGSKDIGTDLYSAKIWVILSEDWDETTDYQLDNWNPTAYLYGMNSINYQDSDN